MFDTARSVVAFRNAVRGDGYLFGEINAVGCTSKFFEFWMKYEFRHSHPYVVLQVNTEIGEIQVDVSIRDARDGSVLSDIFEPHSSSIDELIGTGVYLYPNDDFEESSISNRQNKGDNYHRLRLKDDRKVKFRGSGIGSLNMYPRRKEKLHSVIQCTDERTSNTNGWLEAELELKEHNDKNVLYATRDEINILGAEWNFDDDLSGVRDLESFTSSLSAIHCLEDESPGAKVWIKPVWDLEWYECRDEMFLSDDEYWVICQKPSSLEPTTTQRYLNKIGLFNDNKMKRGFSADRNPRVGKSAKSREDWFVKSD